MNTMIVPSWNCPSCDMRSASFQAVQAEDAEHVPRRGDCLVCMGCGAISVVEPAGLPAVRLQTPAEFARIEPDVQQLLTRAQQEAMDRSFLKSRMHYLDSPEQVTAARERAERTGMVAIIGGVPCSEGPAPPIMRPAQRRNCVRCGVAVWVSVKAPDGPVACPLCLARALQRESGS